MYLFRFEMLCLSIFIAFRRMCTPHRTGLIKRREIFYYKNEWKLNVHNQYFIFGCDIITLPLYNKCPWYHRFKHLETNTSCHYLAFGISNLVKSRFVDPGTDWFLYADYSTMLTNHSNWCVRRPYHRYVILRKLNVGMKSTLKQLQHLVVIQNNWWNIGVSHLTINHLGIIYHQ